MLTAASIKAARPKEKPYKIHDGNGLFLIVRPNDKKWWRFRYKLGGKTKELSMGTFPDTSLRQARFNRDEARVMLRKGIDPSISRKALRTESSDASNTFAVIAKGWHTRFYDKWTPGHAKRLWRTLEKDALPWLGKRSVTDINPVDVLSVLRRVEERGAIETAHRVLSIINQIMRYAVQTGRLESNPARDLTGALPPARVTHHAAITDPTEVGELLRAIDGYQGDIVTRTALRLAPLVFVRPGELRHSEWGEIDLISATWEIPANKMKRRLPHIVPLSSQAVALLEEIQAVSGESGYVFPSLRTKEKPISENTINAALRRLGYTKEQMTGHGFRAMARTLLDELLGFPPDIIEHQLAHAVRGPLGRAYNRTQHLDARREMMQKWANYLDELKNTKPIR